MQSILEWAPAIAVLNRARQHDFLASTEPRESAVMRVEWMHIALAVIVILVLLFFTRSAWSNSRSRRRDIYEALG